MSRMAKSCIAGGMKPLAHITLRASLLTTPMFRSVGQTVPQSPHRLQAFKKGVKVR